MTEPTWENPTDLGEEIGETARELDTLDVRDRARLDRTTRHRVLAIFLGVVLLAGGTLVAGEVVDGLPRFQPVILPIIATVFVLETFDSAAGMGTGTALAPLLFSFGYEPLEVVPALLVSEAFTGLLAGFMHNEFDNVDFTLRRPWSESTIVMLAFAGVALAASLLGILLTYLAFSPPNDLLKLYVAVLVIAMGLFALVHEFIPTAGEFRPWRLGGFGVLAGLNKGLVGGGYGPVATLGQILSGVHEKTATAITTMSEGLVASAGVLAYLVIWLSGQPVDFGLVPPLLLGGSFAAVLAPYLVRVVPRHVFGLFIPVYALLIGAISLVRLYASG